MTDDNIPSSDFTEQERRRLRRLMIDQDRASYAWGLFVKIVGYTAGVAVFLLAFKDGISHFFKGIMK